MDGLRFDRWTQALARRRTLQGVAGGILSGLLGWPTIAAGRQRNCPKSQRCGTTCCKRVETCRKGTCVRHRGDAADSASPSVDKTGVVDAQEAAARCKSPGRRCKRRRECCSRICKQGRCRCDDGRRPCDGVCCDGVCCAGICCRDLEGCLDGQCVDECEDRKRNGDESDVDCGGPRCLGCEIDQGCFFDTDCRSGICEDAKCRQCRIDDHCRDITAAHCVDLVCVNCRDDDNCGEGVCVDNRCRACREDSNCPTGEVCANFQCIVPATCPAGRDLCRDGFVPSTSCGKGQGCFCFTTEASETLCLASVGGRCPEDSCAADAECVTRHGPGAFCVVDSGTICNCRFCAARC